MRRHSWLDEAVKSAEILQQQGTLIHRGLAHHLIQESTDRYDIQLCRRVKSLVFNSGLESVDVLVNHLIRLFASCGGLVEANELFSCVGKPSSYTWNSIIGAHANLGEKTMALQLYTIMQKEGVTPDKFTFLSILKACWTVDQGKRIHDQIRKSGLQNDVVVGSTLVDMYARCRSLDNARKVFDALNTKNIVTWSAMIGAYAQCGEGRLALECFGKMQHEGMKPSKITFLSMLKACGSIGAVEQGRNIHKQIIEDGLTSEMSVGNALVDMYSRCGNMEEANTVFKMMPKRDVATWGAMIAGYAQCGNVKLAGQYLKDMQLEGIKPDKAAFSTVLAACSHAGLVNDGSEFFTSMIEDYDMIPDIRHHSCMIDLLGRSGHLRQAEKLVKTIQPDIIVWTSVLSACKMYGNVELARKCFDKLVLLDQQHAGGYVLMSSIYSDAGMWKDAAKVEERRQQIGAWKKPAKAWIEIDNKLHEFIVGDKTHPQREEIYNMLKTLSSKIKEAGYLPKLDLIVQQMSDDDKEDALCGHCEKLAVAYGLISTPPGTTIRATKNLRVCMDCHNATKIISKIEQREIIIRDAYHVHHFSNGTCSCKH